MVVNAGLASLFRSFGEIFGYLQLELTSPNWMQAYWSP